LLLAAVGLFGTIAYTVQQRTREFGLRRALGATSGDLLRSLVRSALTMIAGGAIVGLVLAIALARLMTALLFGVAPLDPVTLALVPLVLAITGTIAIAGPAWRATRIDPAVALRE
jgi:putative ABC transport system permease protein